MSIPGWDTRGRRGLGQLKNTLSSQSLTRVLSPPPPSIWDCGCPQPNAANPALTGLSATCQRNTSPRALPEGAAQSFPTIGSSSLPRMLRSHSELSHRHFALTSPSYLGRVWAWEATMRFLLWKELEGLLRTDGSGNTAVRHRDRAGHERSQQLGCAWVGRAGTSVARSMLGGITT